MVTPITSSQGPRMDLRHQGNNPRNPHNQPAGSNADETIDSVVGTTDKVIQAKTDAVRPYIDPMQAYTAADALRLRRDDTHNDHYDSNNHPYSRQKAQLGHYVDERA